MFEADGCTADGLEIAKRSEVNDTVARAVWVKAGGRCTFCNTYLLTDEHTGQPTAAGQLAHIVGATTGPKSPRGADPLPASLRNAEANLLLCCHAQHRVIDDHRNIAAFTVDLLRRFKREHEDRIKSLTGLRESEPCLVIRCVGKIRGDATDIPDSAVTAALLPQLRFPRFALRPHGREYEVDLRDVPGEGSDEYWQRCRRDIHEQLQPLQRERATLSGNSELAVFGYGRIPVLIALGTELDDTITTRIFQRHRSTGTWAWPATDATVAFDTNRTQQGQDPHRVAVTFSLTASVDVTRAPGIDNSYTVYDIRPHGRPPAPELLNSAADLENFRVAWQQLLADIERKHSRATQILVMPAVPPAAAIEIGRTPMRHVQPPLQVLERADDGSYNPA